MSVVFHLLKFPSFVAPLRGEEAAVGRSLYCTLVLGHGSVSRVHAAISQVNGVISVRDLGSKNGTYVNGLRVGSHPVPFGVGDRLRFGDVECVVDTMEADDDRHRTTDRPTLTDAQEDTTTLSRKRTDVEPPKP